MGCSLFVSYLCIVELLLCARVVPHEPERRRPRPFRNGTFRGFETTCASSVFDPPSYALIEPSVLLLEPLNWCRLSITAPALFTGFFGSWHKPKLQKQFT